MRRRQASVTVIDLSAAQLRQRVLGWLARREHSVEQVRRKLARLPCSPEIRGAVVDALLQEGYLSDARFAESLARSRRNRGFGPLRIAAELRQQGVDAEVTAPHLQRDSEALLAQARAALAKRFGDAAAADRKALAQRARFLSYRGFPTDILRRALDTYECKEENDA